MKIEVLQKKGEDDNITEVRVRANSDEELSNEDFNELLDFALESFRVNNKVKHYVEYNHRNHIKGSTLDSFAKNLGRYEEVRNIYLSTFGQSYQDDDSAQKVCLVDQEGTPVLEYDSACFQNYVIWPGLVKKIKR